MVTDPANTETAPPARNPHSSFVHRLRPGYCRHFWNARSSSRLWRRRQHKNHRRQPTALLARPSGSASYVPTSMLAPLLIPPSSSLSFPGGLGYSPSAASSPSFLILRTLPKERKAQARWRSSAEGHQTVPRFEIGGTVRLARPGVYLWPGRSGLRELRSRLNGLWLGLEFAQVFLPSSGVSLTRSARLSIKREGEEEEAKNGEDDNFKKVTDGVHGQHWTHTFLGVGRYVNCTKRAIRFLKQKIYVTDYNFEQLDQLNIVKIGPNKNGRVLIYRNMFLKKILLPLTIHPSWHYVLEQNHSPTC